MELFHIPLVDLKIPFLEMVLNFNISSFSEFFFIAYMINIFFTNQSSSQNLFDLILSRDLTTTVQNTNITAWENWFKNLYK